MKFILCNFSVEGQPLVENYFDQVVLKEVAFNSKVVSKLPDGNKNINYNLVLVPVLEISKNDERPFSGDTSVFHIIQKANVRNNELLDYNHALSITNLFKDPTIDVEKTKFSFTILGEIDDSKLDIFYTDGSFKKATEESSYAVCKLLNEEATGKEDLFTGKKYNYQTFSSKLTESTNNIGELTGIKTALENTGDKIYQVIISDSEYGIKCFREWYYNWKNNNFKTYAKKDIQNKELIQEIFNLTKGKKIIIFKWVKGHNKDYFNELCDELAKEVLK